MTTEEVIERCQSKYKLIDEWEKEKARLKEQVKDLDSRITGAQNEVRTLIKGAGLQGSLPLEVPPRDTVIAADPNCEICAGKGFVEEKNGEKTTCPCLEEALERVKKLEAEAAHAEALA